MVDLKKRLRKDLLTVSSFLRNGDLTDIEKLHTLSVIDRSLAIINKHTKGAVLYGEHHKNGIIEDVRKMIDEISFKELRTNKLGTDKLLVITNIIELIEINFEIYAHSKRNT